MTEVTQERSMLGNLATNPSPAEAAARSRKLDFDRGVVIVHGGLDYPVAYYVDDPGRYFNEQGIEVSEDVARRSGIDTLKFSAERRRKEARDKAYAGIEAQFQAEKAAIEAEANALVPEPEVTSAPEATYAVPSKSADAVAADALLANREKKQ